jgi:predicted RNase H-like nuclease (RuvC/YqgF family)
MESTVVVALIAAGASLVAALFAWRSSGRATDVNQQAANLAWVKELRQDASDARDEVEQLRTQVRELRRQLDAVTREADHWITEHQSMRRHANRPGMTIERLRELIGPVEGPATANGH